MMGVSGLGVVMVAAGAVSCTCGGTGGAEAVPIEKRSGLVTWTAGSSTVRVDSLEAWEASSSTGAFYFHLLHPIIIYLYLHN